MNRTAPTSARAAVGDQRAIARGRGVVKNSVSPPNAPLTALPLLVKVPLPAVELVWKKMKPPVAPLTVPPLVVKVPLPAVEVSLKNCVPPPPLTVPPLLVKVPLPAVEVSAKNCRRCARRECR